MEVTIEQIDVDIKRLRGMQMARARNIGVLEAAADKKDHHRKELEFLLKAGGHPYNDDALRRNVENLKVDADNIRSVAKKEQAGIEQCDYMIGVLEEKKRCLSETISA